MSSIYCLAPLQHEPLAIIGFRLATPCGHHDFRRERRVFGSLELEAEQPRERLRSDILGQEQIETSIFIISGKAHVRFPSTHSWLVQ